MTHHHPEVANVEKRKQHVMFMPKEFNHKPRYHHGHEDKKTTDKVQRGIQK